MLCNMLARTGVAGRPESYFHRSSIAGWEDALSLPTLTDIADDRRVGRVFAAVRATGSGGICGIRLQGHGLGFFRDQLEAFRPDLESDRDRLEAAFGRVLVIHLSRADKVAQAVSYVKAEQSGLWHAAPDGAELERLSPPRPLVYDPAAIERKIAEFRAMETDWANWFDVTGITPHRIDYETLASQPNHVLRGILEQLGQNPALADSVAAGTKRLSDQVSRAWQARYIAEHRNAAP